MPSIKQFQSRISTKKKSLNKVNLDIAKAASSKNRILSRRLNQEKSALDRDIRKLERQLIDEERVSREKNL